uniref:LigA n=1 Tax=Parastrongyloides trichosuri TaxID=131310 RepID=A0A0N4Z890_PARTI
MSSLGPKNWVPASAGMSGSREQRKRAPRSPAAPFRLQALKPLVAVGGRHGALAASAVAVAQQQVAGLQRLIHPVDQHGRGLAQRLQRIARPDHDVACGPGLQLAELAVEAEDAGRIDRDRLDGRRERQAVRHGVARVVADVASTVGRALIALDGDDHARRVQGRRILHPRRPHLEVRGQVGDRVQQDRHVRRRDLIGHQPAFGGAVQDDLDAFLARQTQHLLDVRGAVDGDDQRHGAVRHRDQGLHIGARQRQSAHVGPLIGRLVPGVGPHLGQGLLEQDELGAARAARHRLAGLAEGRDHGHARLHQDVGAAQLDDRRLAGEQTRRLEAAVTRAGEVGIVMAVPAARAAVLRRDDGARDAAQTGHRQREGPGVQAVGQVKGRGQGVGAIGQVVGPAHRADLGAAETGIHGDEARRHHLAARVDDPQAGRGRAGSD